MTWVKLDPAMVENPKVQQLSDKAYRAYVQSILWTVLRRTDGVIPRGRESQVYGTRKWRAGDPELHAAGLIHHYGESCDSCDADRANPGIEPFQSGDSQVHGILRFNPSNHEIRERQRRDRGYKKRRSTPTTTPDGPDGVPIGIPHRKNHPDKAKRNAPAQRVVSNYPLTRAGSPPPRTETDACAENGGEVPIPHMASLVVAVREVRPFWPPDEILHAAQMCIDAGRAFEDTLAAFLRCADDPRTIRPSRVTADGPWWRPVTSEIHESKSDARVRRTLARANELDAIERRSAMHAIEGGDPK